MVVYVYFFNQPLLLIIKMHLTVLWNGGYTKAIKLLRMLFISVTFTSHPLNTDDKGQRGKTSINGKTIKNKYHFVLSDTFKHFSVQ